MESYQRKLFIKRFLDHTFFPKGYILFTLLFVTVLGEKGVNLEDIERDNLYLETKTDDVADSKYNIKSEQDQYQGSTNVYKSQNNQPTTYTDLQSVTGSKYEVSTFKHNHELRNSLD